MGRQLRPSRGPGAQALSLRPKAINLPQTSQGIESGRRRVTHHSPGAPSKPIGIPDAPKPLGRDDRSQKPRGNSTGPSGSYRCKLQKAANGAQSPRSPASSSRVAMKDLATATEKLDRLHLSDTKHNQCCVQKNQPQGGQSTTGRGCGARDGRRGRDTNKGGNLKPKSYADAARAPGEPQVRHGDKLFTTTNSSNFACLVCKYILLISRLRGVPIAPETQQCQLVVTERAVRRNAARRHTPEYYQWNDEGAITQLQYHNLDNGQYIQEARALARRLNIEPSERDEFLWRECFGHLYPMFRSIKHLINPHGWDDALLSITALRSILTPQAAINFGLPVSNSWPRLPQHPPATGPTPARDHHDAVATNHFRGQNDVTGYPSVGNADQGPYQPSPGSAPHSYADVVAHPRSLSPTTQYMATVANTESFGSERASQPAAQHEDVLMADNTLSTGLESRASSPGYYMGLLRSANAWDQAAVSTDRTGPETPSSQLIPPGLGRTTNTRSTDAPPPTPRWQVPSSPTPQPENGDMIPDLKLPPQRTNPTTQSTTPTDLPILPTPDAFWSEYREFV